MPPFAKILLHAPVIAPALLLSKCGPVQEGPPAYALAQGCYSLESASSKALLPSQDGTTYPLADAAASATTGARFFLKPTGLGTFLLYDQAGGFLGSKGLKAGRQAEADDDAEWSIRHVTLKDDAEALPEVVALTSTRNHLHLAVNGSALSLKLDNPDLLSAESVFHVVAQPESACKAFPEAPLDAVVTSAPTAKPAAADASSPVVGYADLHTHLGFPRALGGVAMSGDLFHRFGIEHALHDCSTLHGKNGESDLLEGQSASAGHGGHATEGYPAFTYWPSRSTNTHVLAYYRWIQRAYLSGLRLAVTNATGNPTMCQLLGIIHPKEIETNCKSDQDIESQTRYIYELQDYIDAQEGGPGKGWLRIVTSPREARVAIRDNKLAVVLGSEYGTLFDCHEGAGACTKEYVDQKIDELYKMGIRSVFPIHRFDNAFGGTRPAGGANGSWMHLTSKLSTSKVDTLTDLLDPTKLLFKPIGGHYWELEKCPEGIEGTTGIESMKTFIDQDFGFLPKAIGKVPVVGPIGVGLLNYAFIDKLKPLPEYAEFQHGERACNVRPLQDIGSYLIQKIMDRGMILEIDHMSENTLFQTLDVVEKRKYPGIVSSHGWIENTPEVRQRIFRLGGIMVPYNSNPSSSAQWITRIASERSGFVSATGGGVGIGTDTQGIATQSSPEPDMTINYPFSSVDGRVQFTAPKTGDRSFDFTKEGLAHYGLLPEWLEEMRQVDARNGTDAVGTLMRSAEAYIQMWERAEASAVTPAAATRTP